MTGDRDRANRLLEGNKRSVLVQKRHHHTEKSAIAMDVKILLFITRLSKDFKNAIKIINGTFNSGSNIDVKDRRLALISHKTFTEFIVVNFTRLKGGDLFSGHTIHSSSLKDGVVRLTRSVENSVRMIFTSNINTMEVTFSAASSDVTPVLILIDIPKSSKPVQDTNLKFTRMNTIIALNEGITQVVDTVFGKAFKRTIIKVQVVGVS
mmetsp:Transcript_33594/g.60670  ORF Transcript_33594/g.60670 Transcript_33594/m.60670 type:complete len:208 (+) Transcript_33594:875-1498(+)